MESDSRPHCFHSPENRREGLWLERCCNCGDEQVVNGHRRMDPGHGPHVNLVIYERTIEKEPKSAWCLPCGTGGRHAS